MMAGPPERMDLEARYFKTLAGVTHWRIEGANLLLTDGSKTLARFNPAPGA
jgi:heat shock protein HslJ